MHRLLKGPGEKLRLGVNFALKDKSAIIFSTNPIKGHNEQDSVHLDSVNQFTDTTVNNELIV